MARGKDRGIFERPKGSKVWWIRYVDQHGQLHREKVGPKSLAREVYHKRKTEIREQRFFPEKLKGRSILFDEAAKDWLEHAKINKRSWRHDAIRMRRLLKAFGGKPIDAIAPQDVERLKADLKAGGWTEATVNRYLALLKSTLNLALRNGKIERSPAKSVKLFQENNARVRYLTEDEEARLFEALPEELKPLVKVALHTGMRKGELLHLKWEDVDFHTETLTVARSKHGQARRVTMNSLVKETLSKVRREQVQAARTKAEGEREIFSSYVFCAPGGSFWHNLSRKWYPALKGASLQNFHFHDLRHTFCSRLAMAGEDILTIKELAGHKTIAMTLRYSHLSAHHLRQAVERLVGDATDTRTGTSEKERGQAASAVIG